jgi:hypothetical protein
VSGQPNSTPTISPRAPWTWIVAWSGGVNPARAHVGNGPRFTAVSQPAATGAGGCARSPWPVQPASKTSVTARAHPSRTRRDTAAPGAPVPLHDALLLKAW